MKYTTLVDPSTLTGKSPRQFYIQRTKDNRIFKPGRRYYAVATELGDAFVMEVNFPHLKKFPPPKA